MPGHDRSLLLLSCSPSPLPQLARSSLSDSYQTLDLPA
jgi:hypothetical protein